MNSLAKMFSPTNGARGDSVMYRKDSYASSAFRMG